MSGQSEKYHQLGVWVFNFVFDELGVPRATELKLYRIVVLKVNDMLTVPN